MKSWSSIVLSCLCVAASLLYPQAGSAQQGAPVHEPLGRFHIYADLAGMLMQHETFDTDDGGIRVGIAGYRHVGRGWYLGAELAGGGSLGIFGDKSEITMWEFNGKRIFPLGRVLHLGLGGGLSYNHVTYEEHSIFSGDGPSLDDWVPGIQGLATLDLKLGGVMLGWFGMYMLTGDVEGVQEIAGLENGWDYSNVTLGFHVGFLFR